MISAPTLWVMVFRSSLSDLILAPSLHFYLVVSLGRVSEFKSILPSLLIDLILRPNLHL